jgi:TPR repeat protein
MRAIILVTIVILCVMLIVHISADPLSRVRAAYNTGDYTTVFNLLLPLAERGHARAQEMLGAMYASGIGVDQNYDAAAKWSRLAADQGDAVAQTQLGLMYESGLGVPKDGAEAFTWYSLAADQGNALAQSALGAMYIDGGAVSIDVGKGLDWSLLAAEKGDSRAQVRAAVLFEQGVGTSQDYIQAHKWYNLAVASYAPSDIELSAKVARARDQLAAKMSPDQIAEAQKIAREWQQKQHLKDPAAYARS